MFYPKELVTEFCTCYQDILTRNQRQWYIRQGEHWVKAGKKLDVMIKRFLKSNGIKTGFTGLWMFKADIARFLKYAHEVSK